MGFISNLLNREPKQIKLIDLIIATMGKEPSVIGSAYREVSYADVILYIKMRNCKIKRTVEKDEGDWISFDAIVDNITYDVSLGKTHTGNGSVITVWP